MTSTLTVRELFVSSDGGTGAGLRLPPVPHGLAQVVTGFEWNGLGERVFDLLDLNVIDILLAFPWLLLAIGIVAILGPGIQNVIIAVAIVYIPAFARIVRGSVLSIKEKEYVEAARAMGAGRTHIATR